MHALAQTRLQQHYVKNAWLANIAFITLRPYIYTDRILQPLHNLKAFNTVVYK